MQIKVSTRHGQLSEASQTKISTKVEKLSRYHDRLTSIEVIVDLTDESSPRVDLKVAAEHKHDFIAHDQSESLMGSLDAAMSKIEQQLKKHKDKVLERHRPSEPRNREVISDPNTEE